MSSSASSTTSSNTASASGALSNNEHTQKLRVALCQFPVTDDKTVNHQTAQEYIAAAAAAATQKNGGGGAAGAAQLVVLPEIWNAPYATAAFPDYAEPLPDVIVTDTDTISKDGTTTTTTTATMISKTTSPTAALLQQAAQEHQIWLVGGSIPEVVVVDDDDKDNNKKRIYNTSLVFDPSGRLVAKHRKMHLFDIDVPGGITFFESDTLSPGNTFTYFTTPWGNIGLGICYDIRFAEYAMLLCQPPVNCRVLIYPGAFNLTTGPAHWELLQRARAVDNQCFVVTAAPARRTTVESSSSSSSSNNKSKSKSKYPPYTSWGHSTAVSPWGDVLASLDEKPGTLLVDLDMTKLQEIRKSIPIGIQKRTDLYKLSRV